MSFHDCSVSAVMSELKFIKDTNFCSVCSVPANMRCARCKFVVYCGKEHQLSHWKVHKKECSSLKDRNVPPKKQQPSIQLPPPSSWANGFSTPEKMYEWFVDCYRMRVDDNYAWAGGELTGIYNPNATKDYVVGDLIIFALLSVKQNVLPPCWDWSKFLQAALPLIPYAFEKNDAKEKYGEENVFSVAHGGRSLRFTAEIVYASSIMSPDWSLQNKMHKLVFKCGNYLANKNSGTFKDIGEIKIWRHFKSQLKLVRFH